MDTPDPNLNADAPEAAAPAAQPEQAEPAAAETAKDAAAVDNRPVTLVGQVVEALPNTLFRVMTDPAAEPVLAYLGGKMRLHRIRVLIGDRVEIIPEPYGGRARIIRRL